jgi:hypothetical protein
MHPAPRGLAWLKAGTRDYLRILSGMHDYLRTSPPARWESAIRDGLANRESRFLETVRRGVFVNPEHPYTKMFRLAGCGYGDLEEAVRRDGLEAALEALHRQGVWLSHNEFKGGETIVRSGERIFSTPNSFANPLVEGKTESISGGSRSKGTRTRISTAQRIHEEAYHLLNNLEFDLANRCHIMVRPILPSNTAIYQCLRHLRLGGRVDRWFSISGLRDDSAHYRIAVNICVAMSRGFGLAMPFPSYLPPNDFAPVAEWIAQRRREGVDCAVWSTVSTAVRVAEAALEKGLDIQRALFLTGDETLTAAKRARVEATGARIYTRYVTTELGPIGFACSQMNGNCVHLFRDSLAVITHRRPAPFSGAEVSSLLFTTVTPWAPYIFINAEMDDCGIVEPAPCKCAFAAAGFTGQIRDVYSFGKLTGQGMTLVGSDVLRVLEEALPRRVGGGPGDYQLVEREGNSQTRLELRVSPRVRLSSTAAVGECFLEEVRKLYGGALAASVWKYTEGVDVVSAEPLVTPAGKVLSLHLLGPGRESSHAS